MRYILAIILLIFLGAVGIFAVQNTQVLTVQFLSWSVSQPVALLSIGIYVLGMLSGWSVVAFLRRSIRTVSSEERPD